MAISNEQNVLNLLKVYYKDKVESLLLRDSPVLDKFEKVRVEGKVYNMATLYGRGAGVAADFTVSKANAVKSAKNAEWTIQPGQLFSSYPVNAKEIQASLTNRGAYMKVAANKLAAATDGFRKVMSACFYGDAYGSLGAIAATALTGGTESAINVTDDMLMKVDLDTRVAFKSTRETPDASAICLATITRIDEVNNQIYVIPDGTGTNYTIPDGTVLTYAGSLDPSGNPILPQGLGDWLPIKNGRTGTAWTSYISTSFNGVNRSVAPDRLAGNYVEAATDEKLSKTIQNLIKKCRRHGSKADLIVMSPNDFQKLSDEISSTNTYFTATSTKAKRSANIGLDSVSASFSTNYIDNIYDDPFLPDGLFYVLDSDAIELISYTNTDKLDNGVTGNEPGKQDVEGLSSGAENEQLKSKGNYALLIDDYLSITPGVDTFEGPAALISINFFGNWVVTNTGNCGVGILSTCADKTKLPGWN